MPTFKPHNPSLIRRMQMAEGKIDSCKLACNLKTCVLAHVHPTHTHNKQMQKRIKKMMQGLVIATAKVSYISCSSYKGMSSVKI